MHTQKLMYSYIHKVDNESLPYICLLSLHIKYHSFLQWKQYYVEVHCIASFKNICDSNGKTSTDLVAMANRLYFDNFRKIFCEYIFFIFLFFF